MLRFSYCFVSTVFLLAQNHMLRKEIGHYGSECLIGIFMSFSVECQIHIFKPAVDRSQIRLIRISTLPLPQVTNFF